MPDQSTLRDWPLTKVFDYAARTEAAEAELAMLREATRRIEAGVREMLIEDVRHGIIAADYAQQYADVLGIELTEDVIVDIITTVKATIPAGYDVNDLADVLVWNVDFDDRVDGEVKRVRVREVI